MRRIGIGLTAAVLIAALAAPAWATPPDSAGNHKVIVCHATSSESNPYVQIEVDLASAGNRGLKKIMGHYEHAMDPNKNGGTRADADLGLRVRHNGDESSRRPKSMSRSILESSSTGVPGRGGEGGGGGG